MNLGFCSLSSSSSGNCYLIKSETTNLLVDVGISGAKIYKNLANYGIEPSDISHVLLTHEHVDHVKSVSPVAKKSPGAVFCCSGGTLEGLGEKGQIIAGRYCMAVPGEMFMAGDIEVTPFRISHDAAEPVAYTFQREGKKIAIVTDTGVVTEEILEAIKGSDLLVMESNHEVNILLYGSYPYNIKRRILSDVGHLSNEAAGNCILGFLKDLDRCKVPKVLLAHLSQENNTPQQAYITVKNILEEEDFYVGKDLSLGVVLKDQLSELIYI
ncbi:MAG: MBL fold metallo-hydrolase [Firmicutes bacterium]|nr:MBL fold metallo-hydrolase [Bacillota bacterium]